MASRDTRISVGCNTCRVALPCPTIRALDELIATRAALAEYERDDPTLAMMGAYRRENERLRAALAELQAALQDLVDDVDGGYDALALNSIDRIRALITGSGATP